MLLSMLPVCTCWWNEIIAFIFSQFRDEIQWVRKNTSVIPIPSTKDWLCKNIIYNHVYIYMYTYIYVYIYVYICIYICIYIYVQYVYIIIYIHTQVKKTSNIYRPLTSQGMSVFPRGFPCPRMPWWCTFHRFRRRWRSPRWLPWWCCRAGQGRWWRCRGYVQPLVDDYSG